MLKKNCAAVLVIFRSSKVVAPDSAHCGFVAQLQVTVISGDDSKLNVTFKIPLAFQAPNFLSQSFVCARNPSKAPTTTIACFPIPVNALFVGKRCGMRTAGKLCRPSRACRLVFSKRVSSLSLVGSTLVLSN